MLRAAAAYSGFSLRGEPRLGLAEDFQALELLKLTQARLRSKGLDMAEVSRRRCAALSPSLPKFGTFYAAWGVVDGRRGEA